MLNENHLQAIFKKVFTQKTFFHFQSSITEQKRKSENKTFTTKNSDKKRRSIWCKLLQSRTEHNLRVHNHTHTHTHLHSLADSKNSQTLSTNETIDGHECEMAEWTKQPPPLSFPGIVWSKPRKKLKNSHCHSNEILSTRGAKGQPEETIGLLISWTHSERKRAQNETQWNERLKWFSLADDSVVSFSEMLPETAQLVVGKV